MHALLLNQCTAVVKPFYKKSLFLAYCNLKFPSKEAYSALYDELHCVIKTITT